MRINTNIASLNAQEAATNTNNNLRNSLEKLSSGLRINKASDDASGLAIADKLRTQASSIKQSISNGNSAVSLIQIADKAMAEQSNILDTVKQKLIQASTATTSDEGRTAIAKDINKLLTQLNEIASQTNYNGISLLQGETAADPSEKLIFQMGEKKENTAELNGAVQSNTSGLQDMSNLLTGTSGSNASDFTAESARDFMISIDSSLNQLNTWRSDFGSTQNQIESAVRNMMTQVTNIKAAESVIRDVDYAEESANFNKQNIIAQAGTYAQSQANQVQQNILKLLQ
jgi:flagellin